MSPQTLEAQSTASQEDDVNRGSGRAQRIAELTISLRNKANILMQLDLSGEVDCFEQWQQLQRAVSRCTWLWMALEFGKPEYRRQWQASI